MLPWIIGIAALAVILLPFVPGWIELRRGRDKSALHINMEYRKDPRFYGDSFDRLLRDGLLVAAGVKGLAQLEQKTYTVTISRPEKVEVVTAPEWTFAASAGVKNVVYAAGGLRAGEKARFGKELVVLGDAVFGPGARLRGILCQGALRFEAGTAVSRWADSRRGPLLAGPGCDLGRNAVSGSLLSLDHGCRFNNLFGAPIQTFAASEAAPIPAEGNIREKALVVTSLQFSIPAGAELRNNVVASQDLKICAGATIHGDIKGLRNVELEDGVTIHGTIVADRTVRVGANCRILGNVFAQDDVHLGQGCTVGEAGSVKSVISRSAVYLEAGVTIHGHIACEKGQTAEE